MPTDPENPKPSSRGTPHSGRSVLKSVLDPVATAILTTLALKPATSAEVGERLRLDHVVARRHIRRLVDRGQVLVGGRVSRRGRLENLYRADPWATVLDPCNLVGVPRDQTAAANLALTRTMFREAATATESGILKRRPDSSLVRLMAPVDDLDPPRAIEVHRRLLDEVVDEAARARSRLEQHGGESIATVVQALCFEHPFERWSQIPNRVVVKRRSDAGRLGRRLEFAADPLRTRIVEVLCIVSASVGRLSELLEASAEQVRYELDRLLSDGMVRVSATKSNRGAAERLFVTDMRANTLSTAELEEFQLPVGWETTMVRSMFNGALGAIAAQRAGEDDGILYLGRVVIAVDARGFARIATLTERAVAELSDLRDESLKAREEDVLPDRVMLSGLLAFERASAPAGTRARGGAR